MIPQTSNVTNLQLGFCLSATAGRGTMPCFIHLTTTLKKVIKVINFQFKKKIQKEKKLSINYFHNTRISPQIVRLFQQVLTFLLYLFNVYSRQHFAAPIKIDWLHYKKNQITA